MMPWLRAVVIVSSQKEGRGTEASVLRSVECKQLLPLDNRSDAQQQWALSVKVNKRGGKK
jgi:hypothetical protein